MTVRAFLDFIADLRGLTGERRAQRLGHVIEHLQLGAVLEQTIDTLSKGFRRRVGLAQAIVHDPPVLILDEPTDGLDPNQKHEVRTLINDMARDKIIVISTHILEEVDAVCTRAIIIARGRIVADDTPAGLAARSRYHNAVSVQLRGAGAAGRGARRLRRPARGGGSRGERARRAPHGAAARRAARSCRRMSELAARQGIKLKELHLESGRLDEVFRTITA